MYSRQGCTGCSACWSSVARFTFCQMLLSWPLKQILLNSSVERRFLSQTNRTKRQRRSSDICHTVSPTLKTAPVAGKARGQQWTATLLDGELISSQTGRAWGMEPTVDRIHNTLQYPIIHNLLIFDDYCHVEQQRQNSNIKFDFE